MLRRIALPVAAAALAIAASAPFVAQVAGAQRIAPGDTPVERLQQENRQLRQELQLALQQRQDVAVGLDRLEQVNRSNRDVRSARRIASLIHDLESRTGLDQPWRYDRDDGGWGPSYPPSTGPGYSSPSQPSYPPPSQPGYPPPSQPGYPSPSQPSYPPPSTVPPPVPPSYPGAPGTVVIRDRRGPAAMNATDFGALLASVRDAGFTEQQVAFVRAAAERSYFTVDQIVALMGQARFEEARVEIAVSAGAHVVDPERWAQVDAAFSFSGSAQAARTRLGR